MPTIDAKGWICPKPIIETKKLLDIMPEGEVVTVVDNRIAVDNLTNFAQSNGFEVKVVNEDSEIFRVTITKTIGSGKTGGTDNDNLLICITSNLFGQGSEELGSNLMKAYIYALTEAAQKPKTLLFINSGVFLTTEGSEVLESLEALEAQGVEISSCGACLNFYDLTEKLQIGTISNMYAIVTKMNEASNTIKI